MSSPNVVNAPKTTGQMNSSSSRDDGHYGDGHNRNQALAAEEAQGCSQLDAMEAVVHGRGDQAGKNADEHIAIVHLGERVECVGGAFLQRSRVGVAEELCRGVGGQQRHRCQEADQTGQSSRTVLILGHTERQTDSEQDAEIIQHRAAGGRQECGDDVSARKAGNPVTDAHKQCSRRQTGDWKHERTAHTLDIFFHSNLPLRVRLRTVAAPSLVLDCRSGDESSRTYHRTVSVEAPCGVC